MTPSKPNIFDLLEAMQLKRRMMYTSMAPEDKKSFHPVVTMKWLASTQNDDQTLMVNTFANHVIVEVEPDVAMDLLTACTSGTRERYKWRKPNTKKPAAQVLDVIRRGSGPGADITQIYQTMTVEAFTELCEQQGLQDQEIKQLLKSFNS